MSTLLILSAETGYFRTYHSGRYWGQLLSYLYLECLAGVCVFISDISAKFLKDKKCHLLEQGWLQDKVKNYKGSELGKDYSKGTTKL